MIEESVVGKRLSFGEMLVIADYAWKSSGAFCHIIEGQAIDVHSAYSYTVVRPRSVVVGNRPHYQQSVLQLHTIGGYSLYIGCLQFSGSQFSNCDPSSFLRIVPHQQVPELLPEALSYIGLHGELLPLAVELAKSAMCGFGLHLTA